MNTDPVVELKDAGVMIDDDLVLSDINLKVQAGDFFYLIGRVGSGKTSLIRTLNAELPLQRGYGRVAGFSLNTIKRKQIPYLRRKLGIVFQDFQLLSDRSIYHNLAFVLTATGWHSKKSIDKRIDEVLELVELDFKGYKMPHQLSGGEQQRIVIARALLNDPDLILADEPTGNLDPETSQNIMELLMQIRHGGKAIIMATHNYTLLKKFPERTLKCEKGKLTEINQSSEIDFNSLMEDTTFSE